VRCGSIKLVPPPGDGEPRLVDLVWPGEVFGLDCLLEPRRRRWSAVAREDSTVCHLAVQDLYRAWRSKQEALWSVLVMVDGGLHRALEEKLAVSGDRIRNRILHLLESIERRRKASGPSRNPTQIELAELLGVSPEAICRALGEKQRAAHDARVRGESPGR
jgi:CRP-like cAMP-binding protein